MASTPNVYTAEPAFPVLADSLLTPSDSQVPDPRPPPAQPENWSLKEDLERGIQSCSKTSLFRCGAVIGFSRLRTRSQENDEYIGQIPRHLLTTHLRASPPSPEPTGFIIHPSSFDAFAPRTLLQALQSSSPSSSNNVNSDNKTKHGLSREEAIQHLDSVQLFPVHNFTTAAQAVGQVADALQRIQEKRRQNNTKEATEPNHPVVLIVVGLDTLAGGVIRASNPLRGTALLSATLRTLTHLSRAHSSWLSIIMVNTNGLGAKKADYEGNKSALDLRGLTPTTTAAGVNDGAQSIFHNLTSSGSGPTLLPTLLMKTLDQGIDTHLLLSDAGGAQVVEVIKDRVGAGLGRWGVWTRFR